MSIIFSERLGEQKLSIGYRPETRKYFFRVDCKGALSGLDCECEYDQESHAWQELKDYKDAVELAKKIRPGVLSF